MEEIDTFNKWGIGVQGGKIGMLAPPRGMMTPDEALLIASWLVTVADPSGERFATILEKVQST